jgi:hypothetical protein
MTYRTLQFMDRILAEQRESLQVLVFVCGPLLLLLCALIVFLVRGSRTIARFPTFSVKIERVSREDAYVIYRDREKRREFYLGLNGRKAMLEAPRELPVEDIRKIVPNLGRGLAKLGFRQYSISKQGESQYVATGVLGGIEASAPAPSSYPANSGSQTPSEGSIT